MPKLGALLVIIGGAFKAIPDSAPGAPYVKPYSEFMIIVGTGLIGLTARQNNVTSETAGVLPKSAPSGVIGNSATGAQALIPKPPADNPQTKV